MYAAVLKEIRSIYLLGSADDRSHIIAELYASCGLGVCVLILGNAAAEIEIACSVIVNEYGRVKEPLNVSAVRGRT